MTSTPTRLLAGCIGLGLLGLALPVAAHQGAGAHAGTVAAFLHPFTGLDHLLALFAVGLFAGSRRGSGRWLLPAAFLGCMAVAAVGGALGVVFVEVEAALAASLVAVGLALALPRLPGRGAAAALAAMIATLHGHVHGVEVLQGALWQPLLALLAASALIVAGGVLLGGRFALRGTPMRRLAGLAIAAVGGLLLGA